MDLAKFIQNLQQKPEPTKKLILWISTTAIMLVIGSGWIVSLQHKNDTVKIGGSQSQPQQQNNLSNIFESLKKDMGSLKGRLTPNVNQSSQKETDKKQTAPQKNKEEQTENKNEQTRKLYKLPLSE